MKLTFLAPMNRTCFGGNTLLFLRLIVVMATLLVFISAEAQDASQRLSTPRNQSSQRYEVNQTFDGSVYSKDNNLWGYTKEFADLFGMPAANVEDVRGIAAAAFRIEQASYDECGFGGKDDVCRPVEECLLDLYFDETKNPLPWATDIRMQWLPAYSSMRWLRPEGGQKERPYGMLVAEPSPDVVRNKTLRSALIPFADPTSHVQAIFLTNAHTDQVERGATSGVLSLKGYTQNYYRNLSVIQLQFGCSLSVRKAIDIRLEAIADGVFDAPQASFNRVFLPSGFVSRMNDRLKARSDRSATFFRSIRPPQ